MDNSTDASASLVHHPDLWFSDGSVILRAENTLFRVHISQLSRHSAFFRDLFSLPQLKEDNVDLETSGANESQAGPNGAGGHEVAGCPVLQLYDAAEDLGNLLTALYDGPSFGNNDPNDFRIVSGVLRLSTKYIVDSLRTRAIAHLSIAWPSTLKDWDAREDMSRLHDATSCGPRYPSPVAVINVAREVDVPILLSSAFYDLSRYHYTQIFEPNEDGEYLFQSPSSSIPAALSLFDTQKLALGKEASQQAITSLIQSLENGPSQHHSHVSSHKSKLGRKCMTPAACRKEFSEFVELATQHYLVDRERGCTDPLYVAEELGQLKSAEFSECASCALSLETWAARERQRIWKLIPSWFRLDTIPSS